MKQFMWKKQMGRIDVLQSLTVKYINQNTILNDYHAFRCLWKDNDFPKTQVGKS